MKTLLELLKEPAFLALIGTVFGGIGLKVVESLLNKSKTEIDIAAGIRAELRQDVETLRTEIRTVTQEVDEWREKYYNLLEKFLGVNLKEEDDTKD